MEENKKEEPIQIELLKETIEVKDDNNVRKDEEFPRKESQTEEEKADTSISKYGKEKNDKSVKKISLLNEISIGHKLEYRIKRLFFFMGYFSKIGVELRTSYDNEADVITDLDVYGTYILKDFTHKTLWADCKSGKTEVHKRLSWIKGIMTEAEVSDVIFVAPRVRTSVKEYARKSGIQILDLSVLSRLESQYGIKDNDWRGSWNFNILFNRINKLALIKAPRIEVNQRIAKFISSDYWTNDNYSKVKKTITALRDLSVLCELPLSEDERVTVKCAVFELVGLFSLATFDIAREIYYFHDNEKKDTIRSGLISSDISNRRRNEIFDTAVKVAYSFVKNQYPDVKLPDKLPNINLTPPNYFEAFNDLLLRITNHPLDYHDLLRLLDFILMEYDLQEKKLDHEELISLFNNYHDIVLGVKTILHFLCRVTNIPHSFFQVLD